MGTGHHKIDDHPPDIEAAHDDDEQWDDFDPVAATKEVPTPPNPPRPKSLYGLDDEVERPKELVEEEDDPFKDMGMSPVIQRVKKHVVPSHLTASVWEDRPRGGSSALAMDSMDIGDMGDGDGWAADSSLSISELNAEARRAREARRASGNTPSRSKLNATRTAEDEKLM
jgi:hypothetical protein